MPVIHPLLNGARARIPDLGIALGVFLLLNVGGELLFHGFDTTSAWIRRPSGTLALVAEAGLAALLIGHALRPLRGPWRVLAIASLALVAASAVIDSWVYFALLQSGQITTHLALPLPASLLVLATAAALGFEILAPAARRPWGRTRLLITASSCTAVALILPLILMFTFGPTRYARSADCIVVFGARVYSDGTPSDALADRVDEGIRLYQQGLAPVLLMSGAIDEEHGGSEPAAMRERAIAAGVPATAIVVDEEGINSAATVENTQIWAADRSATRIVAVSHYYHLPRVKLLFERAGLHTFTVPATMRQRLFYEPYFLAREVLAYHHALLSPPLD